MIFGNSKSSSAILGGTSSCLGNFKGLSGNERSFEPNKLAETMNHGRVNADIFRPALRDAKVGAEEDSEQPQTRTRVWYGSQSKSYVKSNT